MGLHVLIAESRTVYRKGLSTIFSHSSRVALVDEVQTHEELVNKLTAEEVDFVVAHQSLVTDILLLPTNRFVLLVSKPDKNMLMRASIQGACGYFLENVSEDLLLATLHLSQGAFLLDPALTHWVLEDSLDSSAPPANINQLTPRELEVFELHSSGLSNTAIATRLVINKSTVKKHLEHINSKLRRRTAKV